MNCFYVVHWAATSYYNTNHHSATSSLLRMAVLFQFPKCKLNISATKLNQMLDHWSMENSEPGMYCAIDGRFERPQLRGFRLRSFQTQREVYHNSHRYPWSPPLWADMVLGQWMTATVRTGCWIILVQEEMVSLDVSSSRYPEGLNEPNTNKVQISLE